MYLIAPLRNATEALGHLAVWAGLYAVGCVVFVFLAIGEPMRGRVIAIAFLVTTGTYLLDRVGSWPAWPDRADVASVPRRVRFLRRRVPRIRSIALGLLVVGLAMAASEGLLVALLVPASVAGMLAYSHGPGQSRIKDFLLLKNVAVATSLVALACVLVAANSSWEVSTLALAGGTLWLHVLAGAMLCDVDDAVADARRGTRTIPNVLGEAKTWWAAEVLTFAAGLLLVLAAAGGLLAWSLAWPLAIFPLVAVVSLHVARPNRVRNLVDLLFPVSVLLAACY